jgi:hypothetical protein
VPAAPGAVALVVVTSAPGQASSAPIAVGPATCP